MESQEIKISVRNLVEFVLRSGDLDNRFTGSSRAIEGTKAHQKIQKEYKDKFSGKQALLENLIEGKIVQTEYSAEVSLKHSIDYKGFKFIIEGRVDGLITEGENITIDEIKTVTKPLELVDENYNYLHWAQVKCYAYIYSIQNNLEEINVQLTYYNLNDNELKHLLKNFTIKDLELFFFSLLDKYLFWASSVREWTIKRNMSIKNMSFPFNYYRKGQRELAVAVYGTIREKRNIFVQAPTGIGKTISTLFPAIKAMGEGLVSKIFYLTAKTITRSVAEEAIFKMKNEGLELKTVTLTAKEKICFKENASCNPEECEFARGHFNRVNNAISKILAQENDLNRETIIRFAREHSICPFEFSLDLALWADCIICDYNYVFDPRVYLRRFFDMGNENYTFLIDESHNLIDRAREMFSAELYKQPFLELKKIMKNKSPKISKVLDKINSYMIKLRKICEDCEITESISEDEIKTSSLQVIKDQDIMLKGTNYYVQKNELQELSLLLRKFTSEAEAWLVDNSKSDEYEQLLELYFEALAYLRISELYDKRFATVIEKQGNDIKLKILCLDTSYLLGECIKRAKSSIFFSATLTPIDYFKNVLGGKENDYIMRLPSPFSVENRAILIADSISTKFKYREDSYEAIIKYIDTVINIKKGNYIVFFPSYKYMQDVYNKYHEKYPEVNTLLQESGMSEEEREGFLNRFIKDTEETLVAFAVLGGIFSEGIDLKKDRLIGTIIVGVGLPQLCVERDIIMNYFNENEMKGYEYAYMYPGMNKVLQAAGRVIRTEEDKGIILLIDDRFSTLGYRKLFPKEWYPNTIIKNANDLQNNLIDFWRK